MIKNPLKILIVLLIIVTLCVSTASASHHKKHQFGTGSSSGGTAGHPIWSQDSIYTWSDAGYPASGCANQDSYVTRMVISDLQSLAVAASG